MELTKDGRRWQLGTASDVAWLAGRPSGLTIATALPPVFEAYATFYKPVDLTEAAHERAVIDVLVQHSDDLDWWLGFLDTGAHDVVFPSAPRVGLYWDWPYVLVKAGPAQALGWRTGHMRGGLEGALPDLFFPTDRSWLVSALWDDTWSCVGAPDPVIEALTRDPRVNARRVLPDVDMLPPGLARD